MCRDPKDGELCPGRSKPEETLVEDRRGSDVKCLKIEEDSEEDVDAEIAAEAVDAEEDADAEVPVRRPDGLPSPSLDVSSRTERLDPSRRSSSSPFLSRRLRLLTTSLRRS